MYKNKQTEIHSWVEIILLAILTLNIFNSHQVDNIQTFPTGAHLGGKEGYTSPALKIKTAFEQAICPENAL